MKALDWLLIKTRATSQKPLDGIKCTSIAGAVKLGKVVNSRYAIITATQTHSKATSVPETQRAIRKTF